ncbi:MAG: hypothetical protein JO147_09955 [Actinobacteria bacterium]|nr:hypothetical protein [Actinomycetota bacterium]
MLIDCDTCVARDVACADCVVTMLLGPPGQPVELDEAERRAMGALAAGGLIAPLRMVPSGADLVRFAPMRGGNQRTA